MKRILLSLFIVLPSSAMDLAIHSSRLSAMPGLSDASLIRTQDQFHVLRSNGDMRTVNPSDVDPVLRQMDNETLAKALMTAKIKISQMSNEDYKLALTGELKGGGAVGAWLGFWGGKILVHGTSQAIILGISGAVGLVCPPAAPGVYTTLTAATAIPVETLSNVVALAGGIAGGAVTGPV